MPKNKDRIKFTETDPKLKAMVKRRGLTKNAKKNYNTVFNEIYEEFGVTPSDIVKIGKKEQKPYMGDDGLVDILDLEDRKVTDYQNRYKDFLDEKKNCESTKKLKLDTYRALLGEYDIQKPKSPKIKIKKDRIRESDIISWRDVEKAMDICKGIRDKSILAMLATTGMRGSDLINLKISQLVTGCKIYFDENEEHTIENLLKKDPKTIIPCYEIMPSKTDDKSQLAMTFNTPECSEYLWQYLKDRKNKKTKDGNTIELKPDDPLFATRTNTQMSIGSLEKMFQRINKRLGNEKDKNGIYGKFRKHSMRKLFSTTCRKNMLNITVNSDKTTEMDIVSIFTGHVPPNESNAKAYEAIPDDSEDSYLREIYFKLVPYLSIKDTEVHHVNSKEVTELTDKIEVLETQSQQKDIMHQRAMEAQAAQYQKDKEEILRENAKLKEEMRKTKEALNETKEAVKRIQKPLKLHEIRDALLNYFENNNINEIDPNKMMLLSHLCLDYAKDHKDEFENTPEYLDELIKKMDATIILSPKSIIEQLAEISVPLMMEEPDIALITTIEDITKIISNNEELTKLIGDIDTLKISDIAEEHLLNGDYDLENLTDEDKNIIARDVLLEYM